MNDYKADNRNEYAIPLFLSFCVEQYKQAKGLSGHEAMTLLTNAGVIDYLEENYEVIHTQSPQWILEEIDEFIANKQK